MNAAGRPVSTVVRDGASRACQPMHTLGHPCRIDEIALLCKEWGIPLVEDAAESLGQQLSRPLYRHLRGVSECSVSMATRSLPPVVVE